ncbi:hypothetical protein CT676_33860 [Bradyrhizobium sp. MOS001]|uniref:hypothetical protein n=1 Tax=Bradyrhizobium sp. MOS001 TaxID=2133948 RepID=UPI001074E274|nr:hypothetical protein [Bradyrhizobium sp. MOS001]TFW56679.1 hypothetical protein CT676_33860 [Bradyrhizobium sp. MOS001]
MPLSSISYTSDTVCIFDGFADEIWAMAVGDAEEFELIAGFKRSDVLADFDCFKNLMVWYACEKLAQETAP